MTLRSRALAVVVALVAAASLAAGCAASTPYYDYSKEPDPRNMEFVIGVADGLAAAHAAGILIGELLT